MRVHVCVGYKLNAYKLEKDIKLCVYIIYIQTHLPPLNYIKITLTSIKLSFIMKHVIYKSILKFSIKYIVLSPCSMILFDQLI